MSQANLKIYHYVPGTAMEVFAAFDESLFNALAPAFPPSRLIRYGGNQVGDIVEIELGVRPLTQRWISEIISHQVSADECSFIDVGQQLPFPLTAWQHRHVVRQAGPNRVEIVEDITFSTPTKITTALMHPIIRKQFEARGPKYSTFFRQT